MLPYAHVALLRPVRYCESARNGTNGTKHNCLKCVYDPKNEQHFEYECTATQKLAWCGVTPPPPPPTPPVVSPPVDCTWDF